MYGYIPPSLMQLVTKPDLPLHFEPRPAANPPVPVTLVDRLAPIVSLAAGWLRSLRASRPAAAQSARPCESRPC
jgi:hypothetical protein